MVILSLCVASPLLASPFPAKSPEMLEVCKAAIRQSETANRLPKHLLTAISHTESGRWHKKRQEIIAWPWTVYAEGQGRYLPTKQAAIEEVEKLQAKGVSNIDVGCMQVNLHFHPNAFEDLNAALDPNKNAQYAADLLSSLRHKSKSWNMAIAHYHSHTKKFYIPYRQKVMKIWRTEQRKDTNARMEKARQAYREKRAHLQARIKEASERRFTQEAERKKASGKGAS